MSDFEAVLERLLTDPGFQTALTMDPIRALAGYRLDAEERELLGAQLVTGTGEDRTVEMRMTKSGVVGLLGPAADAFGAATGNQTLRSAPGVDTFGGAPKTDGTSTFGTSDDTPTESFGGAATEHVGAASGGDIIGSAPVEAANYQTRIDVDGDGTWDAHRAYERTDGGVDLYADINNDGAADFTGHDYDRDGLVDAAEFDANLDGTLDTRMYDDSGDGWMDRSETNRPSGGESQSFGQAPAPS